MKFMKGHTINNGRTPWNKGKKLGIIDSDSPLWKGSKATYITIHYWLVKKYGNPLKCSDCGLVGVKNNGRWNIHWASKTKKIKRDIGNFIGLCVKCHRIFDKHPFVQKDFIPWNKR